MRIARVLSAGLMGLGLTFSLATAAQAAPFDSAPSEPVSSEPAASDTYVMVDTTGEPLQPLPAGDAQLNKEGLTLPGNPAECELFVDYVHMRTSNSGFVGFKPRVECASAVTSLTVTGQLWEEGTFHSYSQGQVFSSNNSGQRVLTNRKPEISCTNRLATVWFGLGVGTAVINGKTYSTQTTTPKRELLCGT